MDQGQYNFSFKKKKQVEDDGSRKVFSLNYVLQLLEGMKLPTTGPVSIAESVHNQIFNEIIERQQQITKDIYDTTKD
jgi:hypothetical protein